MLPPVSVIMPVYNSARFLREAIESVLAQDYPELELIIIDGASTDGTEAIAGSFGRRLAYYRTERDNVSIAKNFGIGKARHGIIAFMSGDDAWLPQKLAMQAGLLVSQPECAIAICRFRYFLHEGCAWPANFPERLRTGDHTGRICETLVCRREAFAQAGLFDERLETAEDVDWYARAQHAGLAVGEVPEVLLHKRVHDRNISLTSPSGRNDLMRALGESIRRKKAATP